MRGTPYRWLDIGKLAKLLLPQHQIGRTRYFTALVTSRPGDPTQAQRQQAYLRALHVDDQDLYTTVITTYIPPRQVGDGPWTPWYADYYHPAV